VETPWFIFNGELKIRLLGIVNMKLMNEYLCKQLCAAFLSKNRAGTQSLNVLVRTFINEVYSHGYADGLKDAKPNVDNGKQIS
jgi:hypothetical protein